MPKLQKVKASEPRYVMLSSRVALAGSLHRPSDTRSWAVSADVIPVVAFLGLLFHLFWIIVVVVLQFSLGSLEGCYDNENSQQHLAVLCLLFSSFVATAVVEVALIVSGLQDHAVDVEEPAILQAPPWRCFHALFRRAETTDSSLQKASPSLVCTKRVGLGLQGTRCLEKHGEQDCRDWRKEMRSWLLASAMAFMNLFHVTAYAAYGTWVVTTVPLSYPEDKCWFRYRRQLILRILLYCSWGILFCNWLRVFVFYNMFPVADDLRSWGRHLKFVSCFLGSPHIFRTFEERAGTEPQKQLSTFYKGLLEGLDLTPTDQLTAVLLLNRLQSAEKEQRGHVSASASQGLSKKELQDAAVLAKFALAAYCHKVDSTQHSKHSGEYQGIAQTAGIGKADVLYVNLRDALLGDLPYFVALDRAHQRIVIAFQGTCSVADMFTDAVALPKSGADQWFCGQESEIPSGLYIHSGALQAAHAVWSDMTQIGLVQALVYPDKIAPRREGKQHERSPFSKETFHGAAAAVLKDHIIRQKWQLVTTGHSLGAGVAVLIAARLREIVADTRCWAFCPPGGFCGPNLAGITAEFCTSVVMNEDMVPRTSIQSMNGLLESLIVALARCRLSTLRVLYIFLIGSMGRWRLEQIFRPFNEIPEETWTFLQRFHDASIALPADMSMTMHPPGSLVLFRPLKRAAETSWRTESVQASELLDKGIIVSKGMLTDHGMQKLMIALNEAAARTISEEIVL